DNTANGYLALRDNTSGEFNSADGKYALLTNTIGDYNTAHGGYALASNTAGNNNTAIGFNALSNNNSGYQNIALGASSGIHFNTPNIYNTISIGNDGLLNAFQNQVIIGNNSTGFIGGKVTWSVVSDARIKNTVMEDVKGLDFILRLR